MGAEKARTPWYKILLLAVLAGCYLSFGCLLAYTIGGQIPEVQATNPGLQKLVFGAFGLPFGLALIVICGAELFTSNCAFMASAFYERRCTFAQLCLNWFLSFFGNLVGSLIMVWWVDQSYVLTPHSATSVYPVSTSISKTHEKWGTAVLRGILCNWLVVLGVWQATASQDIIGKIFGIYFPILCFVACGFDHVVANMFLVPMGLKLDSGVAVGRYIWHSMCPNFIGNLIAGAILVAFSYAVAYGTVVDRILYSLGIGTSSTRVAEPDGIDDSAHAGMKHKDKTVNGTGPTEASSMV